MPSRMFVRVIVSIVFLYAFEGFAAANDACRRIVHRGARPAVLRVYDNIESDRTYKTGPDDHLLLVLDEGDQLIVDATMTIVAEECVADKHESYHFSNLTDLQLKYADVVSVSEVIEWLERR